MGTPLQKDLIEPGAEDNATAVEFNTLYRRAKSEAAKASNTSIKISGVRFKFNNLVSCSLALPKVSQLKAKMPARGLPRSSPAATKLTIPTGEISVAVFDPAPGEVDEGKCTTVNNSNNLGSFDLNTVFRFDNLYGR